MTTKIYIKEEIQRQRNEISLVCSENELFAANFGPLGLEKTSVWIEAGPRTVESSQLVERHRQGVLSE